MDSSQTVKLQSILNEARKLPPEKLDEFLDQTCAQDTVLREAVELELAAGTVQLTLVPGDMVAGRFAIIAFVGRGGMGEVYRARDLELGEDVALKTILPARAQDPRLLTRFRREVQLARQVTHPNICRIYDVGRDSTKADLIFLTMEFLEGEPLSRRLRRERLGLPQSLDILQQMADGLDALHAKGIVHRDLKPGNVLLVQDASGTRAVISDFGLARALESNEDDLSASGAVIGTPEYMAPEQVMGETVTPRMDVYAFGLIMFELVTGRRPFASTKSLGQAVLRVTEAPPSPREFAPDLAEAWAIVITKCLARQPEDRYSSAGEAIATLVACMAGAETRLDLAFTPPSSAAPEPQRKPWGAIAIGLAVACVALFLLGRSLSKPDARGAAMQEQFLKARAQLDAYYKQENVDAAAATLKGIVRQDPKSALARAYLCRAYFLQPTGEKDARKQARETCAEAVALDPEIAPAHVTLGVLYIDEGKIDLAAQELQQALRINSRDPAVHGAFSALYRVQGRLADVEPAIQRAVDLAPEEWRWHNLLGLYLRGASRFKEAAREFQKVVDLTPDNSFGFSNLGLVYLDTLQLPQARDAFQMAVTLRKDSAFYNNLGNVLELEGRFDEAAEVTRKSLEIDPSNYSAWFNLGFCLQWGSAGLEKAKEAYQKAVEFGEQKLAANPKDARVLADLASVYILLGDKEKGESQLRKALALAPENMMVHRRAASTYQRLGRSKEAVAELQTAMRLGLLEERVQRNPELSPLLGNAKSKK